MLQFLSEFLCIDKNNFFMTNAEDQCCCIFHLLCEVWWWPPRDWMGERPGLGLSSVGSYRSPSLVSSQPTAVSSAYGKIKCTGGSDNHGMTYSFPFHMIELLAGRMEAVMLLPGPPISSFVHIPSWGWSGHPGRGGNLLLRHQEIFRLPNPHK